MYATADGANSQLYGEILAYLASTSKACAPPVSSPARTDRERLLLMTDDDSKFAANTEFYGRMRLAFFQS